MAAFTSTYDMDLITDGQAEVIGEMPRSVEASSNATLGGKKWAAALVGTRGPGGERADAPMLGSRWRNTQSSSMLSLLCRDWTPQSNWNWGMKSLLRDKNKLTINSWKPHFLFSRSVRDVFVSSSFIHLMVFIATSGFCKKKHPGDQRPFQLCPERMCSNTGLAYSFGDIGRHGSTAGAQGEVTKKKELTNGLGYPKMMGIVKMWLRLQMYAKFLEGSMSLKSEMLSKVWQLALMSYRFYKYLTPLLRSSVSEE